MQQAPNPPPPLIPSAAIAWLRKPQFLLPVAVVVGMMVVAFGVQPGGAKSPPAPSQVAPATSPTAAASTPSPSPAAELSPTATQAAASGTATVAATSDANVANGQTPASDVAGARSSPAPASTEQADVSYQATQCGALQEVVTPLAIEQRLNGVSVKATRASAYPIDYFRCITLATGGQEAYALAGAVAKAQSAGMTHAVLIDLWITNTGRDFGQVNLRDSTLAAAGQTFAPIGALGGRAEIVVSSGQGRNVTLVAAVKNSVGAGTGPMTLSIAAPLFGGQPTQGKYQLFLPTQ